MTRQNRKGEAVTTTSADFLAEQIGRLKGLFPETFTEGKVDWGKLRATLGHVVDDGPERYTFTWAGKRDAIRLLQIPTRATLVPCREESVNFDQTQHLFIGVHYRTLLVKMRGFEFQGRKCDRDWHAFIQEVFEQI